MVLSHTDVNLCSIDTCSKKCREDETMFETIQAYTEGACQLWHLHFKSGIFHLVLLIERDGAEEMLFSVFRAETSEFPHEREKCRTAGNLGIDPGQRKP